MLFLLRNWINFVGLKCIEYNGTQPFLSKKILYNVYRGLKWITHKIDGLSHIERLCLNFEILGIEQTFFDIYLQFLLSKKLQGPLLEDQDFSIEDAVKSIISIKKISDNKKIYRILKLSITLYKSLQFNNIKNDVQTSVKWDNEYEKFQDMFTVVFNSKTSSYSEELSAVTTTTKESGKDGKNWVLLGFQGNDPSTDFRQTGKFGLNCYHYFICKTEKPPDHTGRKLLVESGSLHGDITRPWYSLALVSIHISNLIMSRIIYTPEVKWLEYLLKKAISLKLDQITEYLLSGEADALPDFQTIIEYLTYQLHESLLLNFHDHWENEVSRGLTKTVLDTESSLDRYYKRI